jgi:hypothetical protein
MNHWKVERVTYRDGIQQFGSLRFALSFGILFLQPVVLSSSVFSSFADAQNSISSKLLVR